MKKFFSGKYAAIVISASLFLLLDAVVLLTNVYISRQLADDAHAIQLASRQRTLFHEVLAGIYQVRDDAASGNGRYMVSIDRMAEPFHQFDETLDSFLYGAQLIGLGQDADKLLLQNPVYHMENAGMLKDIEQLWKEYRNLVSPITYAYFSGASPADVLERANRAIVFARQNREAIDSLLKGFSLSVERMAETRMARLRQIQLAGVGLAAINFLILVFYVVGRLERSDQMVDEAQREVREILSSVSDGLFLIDRSLTIGDSYSDSLKTLFGGHHFAGKRFVDLLRPLVAEEVIVTVREYLQLLFAERIDEALVRNLNPLDQVVVSIARPDGSSVTRHLQFQMRRTWSRGQLAHVLVVVKDISEEVRLRDLLVQQKSVRRDADVVRPSVWVQAQPRR